MKRIWAGHDPGYQARLKTRANGERMCCQAIVMPKEGHRLTALLPVSTTGRGCTHVDGRLHAQVHEGASCEAHKAAPIQQRE